MLGKDIIEQKDHVPAPSVGFGSFGHVTLALESRTEERDYNIIICQFWLP